MTTHDWFARLKNGQVICGKTVGSFANIKSLEMDDLWVNFRGNRYAAPRKGSEKPLRFDFFVSMAMEPEGIQAKAYKLISLYPDCRLTRLVFPDGRTEIRREAKRG
ncbi:MAG: hypothetical protein GXP46_01990 [Deferribacteres bacterium]|nr:hypothetical protein [Deferribacteres bacterium]